MQKSSSQNIFVAILIAVGVFAACIFALQFALPQVLNPASDQTAQPASTGQNGGPQVIATALPQAPIGSERQIGNVIVTIVRVVRPADEYLGNDLAGLNLLRIEETMFVEVKVHCIPLKEACPLDIGDFALRGEGGAGFEVDLIAPSSVPHVSGLLTTGDVPADKALQGFLLYRVQKSWRSLVMFYPVPGEAVRFTVSN
jgi:hypothetical protein